jgi:hypothetical protein
MYTVCFSRSRLFINVHSIAAHLFRVGECIFVVLFNRVRRARTNSRSAAVLAVTTLMANAGSVMARMLAWRYRRKQRNALTRRQRGARMASTDDIASI